MPGASGEMPMVPMGEVLPGAIMGTFFSTMNLVDLAMCMSGTEAALSYYRAWPLPIIGTIKSCMALLIPLILIDGVGKVRAFVKRRDTLTWLGLVNAFVIVALFYCIPLIVIPSELAVKEPIALKGKAKAAAEDKLVDDLYFGVLCMLGINLTLLILGMVQLGMQKKKAA